MRSVDPLRIFPNDSPNKRIKRIGITVAKHKYIYIYICGIWVMFGFPKFPVTLLDTLSQECNQPKDPKDTQKTRYTMDNRRLYCLQKAAVALYPKEVRKRGQIRRFFCWFPGQVRVLVKVMRQEDGSCREAPNKSAMIRSQIDQILVASTCINLPNIH